MLKGETPTGQSQTIKALKQILNIMDYNTSNIKESPSPQQYSKTQKKQKRKGKQEARWREKSFIYGKMLANAFRRNTCGTK